MARPWSAEAYEVPAAQLAQIAQEMVLIAQPRLVLRDHGGAVAVAADPVRIAPFAAAADEDGVHLGIAAVLV